MIMRAGACREMGLPVWIVCTYIYLFILKNNWVIDEVNSEVDLPM